MMVWSSARWSIDFDIIVMIDYGKLIINIMKQEKSFLY